MAMPANIENQVAIIGSYGSARRTLSDADKRRLAEAQLKVALWACQSSAVKISHYSLSEILGPDTAFVFAHAGEMLAEIAWVDVEDRLLSARRRSSVDGIYRGDALMDIYR